MLVIPAMLITFVKETTINGLEKARDTLAYPCEAVNAVTRVDGGVWVAAQSRLRQLCIA